jgi:hypothetical protein
MCIIILIGVKVRPQRGIRSKKGTQLSQANEKWLGFIEVIYACEDMQTRLSISKEPVLFNRLIGFSVRVPHDDATICSSCCIDALYQLEFTQIRASRCPEPIRSAVAVDVGPFTLRTKKILATKDNFCHLAVGFIDSDVKLIITKNVLKACLCSIQFCGCWNS